MAILVGIKTVLTDNPSLTARIPNGRNPVRVIMDSTLKIPMNVNVITDNQAETWIFTSKNHDETKKLQLEERGIRVFVTSGETSVNPKEVVAILGEHLVSSLFLEGGGNIHASFLEHQLVDKVVLYFAPKLVGGKEAPTFLEGTGVVDMQDALDLTNTNIEKIGKDFKFTGYPVYKN